MPNYRRARVPGACYFFTVVTCRRRPVFANAAAVEALRASFRAVRAQRPFVMDAAVVLPDHLHCLWTLPDGDADFSGRWRAIKAQVTRRIGGGQTVWQARFWEHLIRDEADWQRHLEYILYNPVKHGLAETPGRWPYSSFRHAVRRGWVPGDWAEPGKDVLNLTLE